MTSVKFNPDWQTAADAAEELAGEFRDIARALQSFALTNDPKDYYRARGIDASIGGQLDDLRSMFRLVRVVEED
jgi:hypothetical protein